MVLIDPRLSCTRCGAPFGSMLCTECRCGEGDAPARDESPATAQLDRDASGTGALSSALTPASAGSPSQRRDATPAVTPVPAPAPAPAEALPPALDRCLAAAVFDGPPARIIRAYKDAGERRLAPVIAEMLLDAALHAEQTVPERYGGILSEADGVAFVPATAEAYRRRGFDHMEAVARPFAALAGIPLVDALAKRGRIDQRALDRADRMARSRGVYEVVEDVRGRRLLLLDDVITTGATLSAAVAALKRAGAARVEGLALARVWR